MEILEKTIFYVNEIDGEKFVHFCGYAYDNGEHPIFVEYAFFLFPLKDCIGSNLLKVESEWAEHFKQYLTDYYDYDDLVGDVMHYDNGNAPKQIDIADVTMDLPEGCYILS